jgi:hypothetical protein
VIGEFGELGVAIADWSIIAVANGGYVFKRISKSSLLKNCENNFI